jgi:hypothetical protein
LKLAKKTLKLNYRSVERFSRDYAQIKKGKIFLRSETPLPAGSRLCLEFNLSGIDPAFMANGRVALSIDKQAADRFKKPQGMLVVILGGFEDILKNLDSILCENEEYRKILGLPYKIAVSQDSPEKRIDKHRIPPTNKKAQEYPITPIALDAKTLYKNGTAADPAKASEAKKIHVEIIGEEVKRESKKIKAAEPAEETLSSENSELEDAEFPKKNDDTALSLDWIKWALAQEKVGKEKEVAEEPETTAPPITEKKSLSAKEREEVKPAGDFLMDLTKAMLRSGYYASDHPGSKKFRGNHDYPSRGRRQNRYVNHGHTGRTSKCSNFGGNGHVRTIRSQT